MLNSIKNGCPWMAFTIRRLERMLSFITFAYKLTET